MKTWTVKPYYTPHEEFDPLGVFEIQEVKAEAESWDDASLDADPNSDEEQAAIDRRDKVTSETMALITAAPDLLAALDSCLEIMIRAIGERLPIQQGTECEETDWQTAIRKARAAIAKAERGAK